MIYYSLYSKNIIKTSICLPLVAAFLVLFCTGAVFSQEIVAKVTLNVEPLPTNKKDELRDFASKVEQYINNHDWTQGKYPYSLGSMVGILLKEVRSTYEDRYSGEFYIATDNGIQHRDKYWDFAYNRGDNLMQGQSEFSPLLGLIDYYVYLVLAEEMDKVGALQGTPYYQKAIDICNQGKFCRMPRWWDERARYVQALLREDHKSFRLLLSHFEQVITSLNNGNKEETRKLSKEVFHELQELTGIEQEHIFCKDFFEQNYKDLLAIVKLHEGDTMYDLLISLDPDHMEYYKNNR